MVVSPTAPDTVECSFRWGLRAPRLERCFRLPSLPSRSSIFNESIPIPEDAAVAEVVELIWLETSEDVETNDAKEEERREPSLGF